MRIGKYVPPVLALSAEEAAILTDELNQSEAAFTAALVETNTAVDVANIYQDARQIERDFDNAEVLALSDIVTQLGSSLTGQVVVVDYKPTFESISEHLQNGWKKIVELLRKAWAFIKNFFDRIFSYRSYLRHRVGKLRAKIETLEETPIQEKPVISVPVRDGKIFTTQGKKLIDTASYQQVMKDIFTNIRKNFQLAPTAINALGEGFMAAMHAVTPTAEKEELEKTFTEKISNQLWRYFSAFGINDFKRNSVDSHITNTFTAASLPQAGSARVAFTWGTAMNDFFIQRKTEDKLAYVIRDLAVAKCEVVQEREITPSNSITMPAFKYRGMLAALTEVEDGLKIMDQLEKDHKGKMHDFSDKFGKVAEEVGHRFTANDDPAAADNRALFNTMLNLPVLYGNLATQPLLDLTKRTMGTFEAVINMVDASTHMYPPKAA